MKCQLFLSSKNKVQHLTMGNNRIKLHMTQAKLAGLFSLLWNHSTLGHLTAYAGLSLSQF